MDPRVEQYFEVDRRYVFPDDPMGYEVEVRGIRGNGILHCLFDNKYNRDKKNTLRREMRLFYQNQDVAQVYAQKADTITEGEICVAKIKGPTPQLESVDPERLAELFPPVYGYHRVQVAQVLMGAGKAIISLVDDYKTMKIKIEDLFHITQDFVGVPSFMVECRLGGLSECLEGTGVVEKVIAAKPPPTPLTVDMFVEEICEEDGLPIVLVRKQLDSRMFDLTDHILQNLDAAINPYSFFTGSEGENHRFQIRDADKVGQIWLSPSPALDWAREMIHKFLLVAFNAFMDDDYDQEACTFTYDNLFADTINEKWRLTPEQMAKGVYLAVKEDHDEEGNYRPLEKRLSRVRILNADEFNNQVTVRHMDNGTKGVYKAQDLFPLSVFDPTLSRIPDLAVNVHLVGVRKLRIDGFSKIKEILGPMGLVSCEIVQSHLGVAINLLSPEAIIRYRSTDSAGAKKTLSERLLKLKFAKTWEPEFLEGLGLDPIIPV